MTNYVPVHDLQVSQILYDFINEEALPNSGIEKQYFWENFSQLVKAFTPENTKLLEERKTLQAQINDWHQKQTNKINEKQYKALLQDIGNL